MRKLIFALLLLLVAVWIGFLVHNDAGYVLVAYADHTVETSLWVATLIILAVFIVLHLLIRAISHTRRIGGKYRGWRGKRKTQSARDMTNKGLCDLAEGNFKAAEASLSKASKHNPTPLINHLASAQAAHAIEAYDQRDEHLRRAHHSTKGAEVAVGLTQAKLQIDSKQWEQALATLNHLNDLSPNHKHILKLLADVHMELQDWANLKTLLPLLKKNKAFTTLALDNIDKQIHLGLLNDTAKNKDAATLIDTWEAQPKAWRQDPQMILLYTTLLINKQRHTQAAELIEKTLKKHWNPELVLNYGLAITQDINHQLATAEAWFNKHPGEPELLLTLGRLAIAGNFPGKAENYLQDCIKISPTPAAFQALATVFERLRKTDEALAAYKKALS